MEKTKEIVSNEVREKLKRKLEERFNQEFWYYCELFEDSEISCFSILEKYRISIPTFYKYYNDCYLVSKYGEEAKQKRKGKKRIATSFLKVCEAFENGEITIDEIQQQYNLSRQRFCTRYLSYIDEKNQELRKAKKKQIAFSQDELITLISLLELNEENDDFSDDQQQEFSSIRNKLMEYCTLYEGK